MKKFKKIYIEITNLCNLKCSFCPPTNRKAKNMTLDEFEYIANKMRDYGDYLYLHVKGEPTMHRDFSKILEICQSLKYKLCITTNGTLLREKSQILLNSKAIHKLHISLHSFEANQIKLSLDEYIYHIIELIKKANFIIVLRLWNDKGANELNNKIIAKLKENFNFIRDDKINDNTYLENGEKFEWADLEREGVSEHGFCYALRDQIGILADGTVIPCCLDNNGDINLGNIYENTIEEIYNSPRAQNLYNGFSNRVLSEKLCKNCGFISRFSK